MYKKYSYGRLDPFGNRFTVFNYRFSVHAYAAIPGTDVYKLSDMPDIDYLVITHDHWDHLDYRTVRELKDRIGTVICPLGTGGHFARWRFLPEKIVELDWNEEKQLDSTIRIHCLPGIFPDAVCNGTRHYGLPF